MGETNVTSELNAMVRKLEVAAGDEVGPGDTLLLLECMKMEIPVFAPRGGRVKAILVEEGAIIAEGQMLAVIEGT